MTLEDSYTVNKYNYINLHQQQKVNWLHLKYNYIPVW